MDAAVWTAIGLLAATSLGTLFYLGSRVDSLAARMDARFDRVDARFDALEGRIDNLDARLGSRLDETNARMVGLSAGLDAHVERHTS